MKKIFFFLTTFAILLTFSALPVGAQSNQPIRFSVVPPQWDAKPGDTQNFTIDAVYADGTRKRTATVCEVPPLPSFLERLYPENRRLVSIKALKPGSADIRIRCDAFGDFGKFTLDMIIRINVVERPIRFSVVPPQWDAKPGDTQNFTIDAVYADGTRRRTATVCEVPPLPSFLERLYPETRRIVSIKALKPGSADIPIRCDASGDFGKFTLDMRIRINVVDQTNGLSVDPPRWDARPGDIQEFKIFGIVAEGILLENTGCSAAYDQATIQPFNRPGENATWFEALVPGDTEIVFTCVDPYGTGAATTEKISIPVAVSDPASARISIGISADPDKTTYEVGDTVWFSEAVQNKNPNNVYTYNWVVDGKSVGTGATIPYTFTKPGQHYVQLELDSSDPAEQDVITMNIGVEYPPDMTVAIDFDPATPPYAIGSTVGFEARLGNATGVTEYRWYVAGEYVGSGQRIQHRFTESGEYEIKLGLRKGSNFDEVSEVRTLVVGDAGVGVLGRYRNRFDARGGPDDLEIVSSYWKGGTSEWSTPSTFNSGGIGAVNHHILHTGDQADGGNVGYLVYSPQDSERLLFKVFHFRYPENPRMGPLPSGYAKYTGQLPLHGKKAVLTSARFTRTASRLCDVEWRTVDGSSCRARISMYPAGTTARYTGMDDLGCEAGVYPPLETVDDGGGWMTEGSGTGKSISPKAGQWRATGFRVMNGSHRFDTHWFKTTWGEDDPFYSQNDSRDGPPPHSAAKVTSHALVKHGRISVRGPGHLAFFARVRGPGPWVRFYDSETGQRFNPQTGGEQTMYRSKVWHWENGRWEGEWSGDWTGNVHDLDGDRGMGGWVPAGQIKTVDVMVEQGWYDTGGSRGFGAPTGIEYEVWFFPREGGGVKVEIESVATGKGSVASR